MTLTQEYQRNSTSVCPLEELKEGDAFYVGKGTPAVRWTVLKSISETGNVVAISLSGNIWKFNKKILRNKPVHKVITND
ncbi:hypothetical protein [Crocosphaera sp.]|uniref:hypothetical protein n=1 Tax=Crocosphaera sp. TaxID=2729996 RepID=UPI002612C9E1|nr:hypothetical protein [Crocosphaera sp.]MDJ0579086.1 hypothetical protein [Crocosphaera sp.]